MTWPKVGGGGSGGGSVVPTPGGSTTQVQYNNAGLIAGAAGLTYDNTTNTLTLAAGVQTASAPAVTVSQTWNNAAVVFIGKVNNFTSLASASNSIVERWTVNGADIAYFTRLGRAVFLGSVTNGADITAGTYLQAQTYVQCLGSTAYLTFGSASDVSLCRISAGVMGLGSGGASSTAGQLYAQTLRTQQVTVASLPSAATAGAGASSFVTDALAPTWNTAVVGGGTVKCKVVSDGSIWLAG